jgi:uncharacterized small protein (DUF1192 family)
MPPGSSKSTNEPWYQGSDALPTKYRRSTAARFARELVESDVYRQSLRDRIAEKTLPPAIEVLLWSYAFGRPLDRIQLTIAEGQEDLTTLSIDELQRRAAALNAQLEEAAGLQDAIPAEFAAEPLAPKAQSH